MLFLILSLLQPVQSEKQVLRNRLHVVDIIISGRVTSISDSVDIENGFVVGIPRNTKWKLALIEVEETFVPFEYRYERLAILFPVSNAGEWKDYPKFSVNDHNVFLLTFIDFGSNLTIGNSSTKYSYPMALNPMDKQHVNRLDEIKRLYINYPPAVPPR